MPQDSSKRRKTRRAVGATVVAGVRAAVGAAVGAAVAAVLVRDRLAIGLVSACGEELMAASGDLISRQLLATNLRSLADRTPEQRALSILVIGRIEAHADGRSR